LRLADVDLVGVATISVTLILNGWASRNARHKESVQRSTDLALLQQTVGTIKDRVDKEFGGNSGGAREKINSIDAKIDSRFAEQGKKIDKIDERTLEQAKDLAKLTGRFDEFTEYE
jgi:ElaB/YqjD/DUF883 family membrane-anchored ribosome-binding protein